MPPWETDHLVWDVYFTCGIKCSLSFVYATLLSKLVKQVTHVSWTSSVNVVAKTRNLSGRKHNPVALVWSFPSRPARTGPKCTREWAAALQKHVVIALLTFSPQQNCWHSDVWLHMTADIIMGSLPQHASFEMSQTSAMRMQSGERHKQREDAVHG